MATNGSFYWNELMTKDAEAAKKFYGATLGWSFEAMDQGGGSTYWIAKVADESRGGLYSVEAHDEDTGEGWFSYVAVTDLSTALARATSEGGEVVREPWDVPGVGRIAIVSDSAGNTLGWMTPSEQSKLLGRAPPPQRDVDPAALGQERRGAGQDAVDAVEREAA